MPGPDVKKHNGLAGGDGGDCKEETHNVTTENDDVIDTRFGIAQFKPQGVQCFATVGWFTAAYSGASLILSTLITYVNSQVTTLERQFGFSSKQTGLIMAANDIGYLLFVIFVSYFAKMVHIPRALGTASIVFGVSGICCSIPHFIFGANTFNDETKSNKTSLSFQRASVHNDEIMFGQMCSIQNRSSIMCGVTEGNKQDDFVSTSYAAVTSLAIIVVGMTLQGFGKAPRASYALIYIDDNTKRVKSGWYIGILISLSILGPAFAFFFGGMFSRIYVTLEHTNLSPKHPKWIGAWWLGFIVFGVGAFLVALPLFCFPRKLPKREHRVTKQRIPKQIYIGGKKNSKNVEKDSSNALIKETKTTLAITNKNSKNGSVNTKGEDSGGDLLSRNSVLLQIRMFMESIFRIVTNPICMLMIASNCFILFMVGGTSAYSPKYLERVFDLPTYKANYIMAGKTLFASCVGTFVGGALSRKYKLTAKKSLHFVVCVILVTVGISVAKMFTYCDQPYTYNWPGRSETFNTEFGNASCNADCHCEENRYFPICGSDGRTYYSPCMAGCIGQGNGTYTNCACIEGGQATQGICPYGCDQVYYFTILNGLRSLFGTVAIIPKITVIIRSVEERDKSLALGVSSFMTSLLGWLLGPLVFGILIDDICALWDEKCGVTGRCLLYDNSMFRWKLNGFATMGVAGSLLFQVLALIYSLKTGCLDDIGLDGRGDEIQQGKKKHEKKTKQENDEMVGGWLGMSKEELESKAQQRGRRKEEKEEIQSLVRAEEGMSGDGDGKEKGEMCQNDVMGLNENNNIGSGFVSRESVLVKDESNNSDDKTCHNIKDIDIDTWGENDDAKDNDYDDDDNYDRNDDCGNEIDEERKEKLMYLVDSDMEEGSISKHIVPGKTDNKTGLVAGTKDIEGSDNKAPQAASLIVYKDTNE